MKKVNLKKAAKVSDKKWRKKLKEWKPSWVEIIN
jgi:hypothetical protein